MAAIYKMGVTAGIFLDSVLLKEMRYLVYIRYLCMAPSKRPSFALHNKQTHVHRIAFQILPGN